MNIWKVIQNGNNMKRTGKDHDGSIITLPPMTAEEHIVVQRESKARTTLLQSIPDDHVANFYYMDDARVIWYAVKARFGGNAKSKKMRKSMLKREFSEFRIREEVGLHKGYEMMQKIPSQLNQLKATPNAKDINLKFLRALPSSWSQVALTIKTKGGLKFLSFDDLYYKLNTLEADVKGYITFSSSQSAGPSHYAFVNATSTSKKISYEESPNYSSTTIYSVPSNSKTGSHRSDNVIEDVLQSFVADTEPEQQLAYEDLEHIEKLDLEEMDLKWQMAMLSVRVHKFEQKAGRKIEFDKKESVRFNKKKVRCYKCRQRGHFATECRAKGENDKQRYSSFKIKEIEKKEEDSNALITVDTLVMLENFLSWVSLLRTKVGMGFTNCISENELGWDDSAFSVFTTNSKDVEGRPIFHRFSKADSMKVVPLPLTGDYTSLSDHSNLDDSHMSYGIKSLTSNDSKSMSNDFISCNNSDKSSEVNTNDFASSDSILKSAEHKPIDYTSCTVGIGVGPAVRPQPVPTGKPKVKPVPTGKPKVPPVPNGKPNVTPVSTGKPKVTPVHTGKPKVTPVPSGKPQVSTPVPTGRPNRPFPVPTDRGYSSSVISGWWSRTDSPCNAPLRKEDRYVIIMAFHQSIFKKA
nr:ribonuclease H-like domain-containing protein [Tanacetum cinerariifolium]